MPVEPKLFPKVFLPPPLQDLLMREAVFSLSRKQIADALLSAQQDLATIVAAKPRLSFERQDAKKDHQQKVLEAEENVTLLESALRKLDGSIPALNLCVDRSLENYLREMDPEYVTGLSAARFSEDWQRFLVRFEQAADRYMSVLGKLPTQLEQLVPGDACGTHLDGRQLIEETVARATSIQDEIAFLNKIADAQRLRGRGQAPTVHRQPERNWRKMALMAVMLRTKLYTNADRIAGRISGRVMRRNVVHELAPRVSEASSRLLSICDSDAMPERTPTGMLRNTKQITNIAAVPVSSIGGTLNAMM